MQGVPGLFKCPRTIDFFPFIPCSTTLELLKSLFFFITNASGTPPTTMIPHLVLSQYKQTLKMAKWQPNGCSGLHTHSHQTGSNDIGTCRA